MNSNDKRILPHQPLPRQYEFLTKHSARSFLVGYTLNKATAPFSTTLVVSHDLGFAPIHDMWFAETPSVTGDYRKDYDPFIEPIWHSPARIITSLTTRQEYYLTTTATQAIVHISHASATSGTYHLYFHIKLYLDNFESEYFEGNFWRVTAPTYK